MKQAHDAAASRLTVLNPGGRDAQQDFANGAGDPDSRLHAPVNFHGYAACTRGSFQRDTAQALAQRTPVLLLLRGDFKASHRALLALKKQNRTVAVSLKETGLHQIAAQLYDPKKLALFIRILTEANHCIACTPEAAQIYKSIVAAEKVRFVPTPYPLEDERWDFSQPVAERNGIFIGTREWDVPSRNHLAALLMAQRISARTDQKVTVYNKNGRRGAALLKEIRPAQLRVIERYDGYPAYLRTVAAHRIVLQLDRSCVPGQVAGDALLCRVPCVGGNGAIDRLAFSETLDFGEIEEIAVGLLTNDNFYGQAVDAAHKRAIEKLGFAAVAEELREVFCGNSQIG
jgi:hypothetical protein